jgi:hypothetical protein
MNVLWFDIAVANALLVHVIKRKQHLVDSPCNALLIGFLIFVDNLIRDFATFVEGSNETQHLRLLVVIRFNNVSNEGVVHHPQNIVLTLEECLVSFFQVYLFKYKTHLVVVFLLDDID